MIDQVIDANGNKCLGPPVVMYISAGTSAGRSR